MEQFSIIYSFPFLKHYEGKKDGKNQVMIRTKLGFVNLGKTEYKKTVDIRLLSNKSETIKITKEEFKSRANNRELMFRILEVGTLIKSAIFIISKEGKDVNQENLFKYVYTKPERNYDVDEMIDNDQVNKIFDHPVPLKVWENFNTQIYFDDETNELVPFEDLEDIAIGVEGEYYHENNLETIQKIDFRDRYKKGLYEKNNIFDCFGFCWTIDPKKNETLIPDSYKSLILRLNDYRFNDSPSELITNLNEEWVQNFLKFLVIYGYSSFQPKNYDPLNILKYKIKLINAERKPYKYASFSKVVKHLKRYIFLLQKNKIIPIHLLPDFINASDFAGRKVNKYAYTRCEHSLSIEEFDKFCKYNFADIKLNTARDMFIIAVLGGGLRGEELFNGRLRLEKRDNAYIIYVFHSKTTSENFNPVIGELKNVIERNGNKFPVFLNKNEFKDSLKKIAEILNFDRIIISPNTFMNADEKNLKFVLKDIFSIYFARKTFVTYLNKLGMHDDDIIKFTSHSQTNTLKHYKSTLTISDKMNVLKRHNAVT